MALGQNDLIRARNIIGSMPEEQKVMFMQKYETLNEKDKEIALSRVLESAPKQDLRSKGIVFAADENDGGLGMGPNIKPWRRQSAIGTAIQAIPSVAEGIEKIVDFGSEYGKVVAKTLDARYTLGATQLLLRHIDPIEAEKIFGEQETLLGKGLSFIGQLWGIATGTGVKVSSAIATKAIPKLSTKGSIGLAGSVSGDIAKRKAAVLFNKIARDALTGGIESTIQIVNVKDDIKDQAKTQAIQGALGYVGGGVLSLAGSGLTRSGRSWKQMMRKSKTPAITKVVDRTKEGYDVAKKTIKENLKNSEKTVSRLESRAKTTASEKINLNKEYVENTLNETTKAMNETVEYLNDALLKESLSATTSVQEKLPGFYSRASSAYGKRLEEISEAISKSDNKITRAEVNQFLDTAEKQLDDAFIVSGPARDSIKMLRDKYKPKMISELSKFRSAKTGERVGRAIKSSANDDIPFSTIYKDLKNVKNSMSIGGKTGTKIYSESDLGVSILDDAFGDIIAKRSPEFAELQRAYAPVARLKRKSNQFFKPFDPDYAKNRPIKAIFDIAENKGMKIDEENLIKAIESGTDFVEGIGPVTKNAIDIGEQLVKARENVKTVTNGIKLVGIQKQKLIDAGLTKRLQMLTNRKDFITSNYKAQEEMIEAVFKKRMKDLGVRQELITNLTKDAGRFKKIRQIAVGGAVGAGASYGAVKIIHSILGRK